MGDELRNRDAPAAGADRTLRSGASGEHAAAGPSHDGNTAPGSSARRSVPVPADPDASRFEDLGEIARGGMGSVRRVYDTVLRREVAMKVGDPGSPAYAQTALRFMEEAQITGQLDHPNIVPVHDLGMGAGGSGVFFIMKLVEGETLTELIDRLHAAPYDHRSIENTLQIFLKICDAVAFAHSRGVVHRDLKPDNVMVGNFGQVYVMDWGVALIGNPVQAETERHRPRVSLSEDLSRDMREESGAIVGTFEYMAPEQAWGRVEEIDERTDVFGLGGLLYHLLTGHGPNAAPTAFEVLQRAQRGRPMPPEDQGIWQELPPGLCSITMRALAKNRENRHGSVLELKADLEDFLRGGGWFQTKVFEPGAAIVTEGDSADAAYIITQGTCDVAQERGGTSVTLRHLGPGDVFGETAVLTGEPRSASVIAASRVTVKVVTREALEHELGSQSWAGAFVKALAQRFRDADLRLAEARERDKAR